MAEDRVDTIASLLAQGIAVELPDGDEPPSQQLDSAARIELWRHLSTSNSVTEEQLAGWLARALRI
jgi:hypothetical protein